MFCDSSTTTVRLSVRKGRSECSTHTDALHKVRYDREINFATRPVTFDDRERVAHQLGFHPLKQLPSPNQQQQLRTHQRIRVADHHEIHSAHSVDWFP
jgi:hypothetical protein